LQHVVGVESALQPPVQAQPHHLFESVAVSLEQISQRSTVPAQGTFQEHLVLSRIAWHG
jgi:hypothetical protein